MKLKTLQSRVTAAPVLRVKTLDVTPGATARLKGPRYQGKNGRNTRWLELNPVCAECMRINPREARAADEVDHIVPLWDGGLDDPSNFQGLCLPHHREKTAAENLERRRRGLA